jgi:hypothetical protein
MQFHSIDCLVVQDLYISLLWTWKSTLRDLSLTYFSIEEFRKVWWINNNEIGIRFHFLSYLSFYVSACSFSLSFRFQLDSIWFNLIQLLSWWFQCLYFGVLWIVCWFSWSSSDEYESHFGYFLIWNSLFLQRK